MQPRQRNFVKAQYGLLSGEVQQAGALEIKADAQLGAHQRDVAEPAKGECEMA